VRRLFDRSSQVESRSISESDALFRARFGAPAAGQLVNNDTANQTAAVWRCRNLIADVCAGLPVDEYETLADGKLVPLRDLRQSTPFLTDPSLFVGPEEFRWQLVYDAVSGGNGYAFVTDWDRVTGRIARAESVSARDVSVDRKGALATPEYKIGGEKVDLERVLHLRAFGPRPGSVLGMNPIEYARTTIGLGMAVRAFGAKWYEKGGQPVAALVTEQKIDDDDAKRAKAALREATMDDPLAVLGNGWDLKSLNIAPDDALFLAATNATSVDICAYHGLPPEMLGYAGEGSSLTYANREQRAIDLLTWTLQWWFRRLERVLSRAIPPGRSVRVNDDDLLRSDALTRWQVHEKAVKLGARNNDEVREIEGEAPLPNGIGQQFIWPPVGGPSPDPGTTNQGGTPA
jgi:HK97 family phage portal protein